MPCALQLAVNNNKKTTLIFSRHAQLLFVGEKAHIVRPIRKRGRVFFVRLIYERRNEHGK